MSGGERLKLILNIEIQRNYYPGYDLLSVVLVGLSEASGIREETPLHGFLGTIFSEKLRPEKKLQILEEKYEIAATEEVKEGVNRMCNLSDAIEERGMQKGIQKGMQKGEQLKMIELICRKVKKGKKPEVIAEELEEDIASVSAIYEAVLKTAPDYNSSRVYELLNKISKDNENERPV